MAGHRPDDEPLPPLPTRRRGDHGRTVVLLHGFTQTMASWDDVAADLAADHRVVTVDAPGHGGASAIRTDLSEGGRLVARSAACGVHVGYSMGGRLALRLALDHPEHVEALVLLGTTAGIDDPLDRVERRRADHALADRIEADGVRPFLDDWLANPLFDGVGLTDGDRAARLANDPRGLAASLRLAGTGTMEPPWWDQLGRLTMPTLVVAGARDAKFCGLGRRLVDGIGDNARFVSIQDAGHAAHLQCPGVFADLVRRFVAELG